MALRTVRSRVALAAIAGLTTLGSVSCEDGTAPSDRPQVTLANHSSTPSLVKNLAGGVSVHSLISSDDVLAGSPTFVFGGSADGAGLLRNLDDTYTMVVNNEMHSSSGEVAARLGRSPAYVRSPTYGKTEVEVLGVPSSPDTIGATVDADEGRFRVDRSPLHRFAFRTSTLRNVELTAPYMHNGVYATLEQVVDFYDRGGGAGIGIELEHQTLAPDRLDLTIARRATWLRS